MMNKDQVSAIIAKAIQTNAERDQIEREVGFGNSEVWSPDMTARTIMCALHCALLTDDWGCVAEAQAMLSELELQLRPPRSGQKKYQPWISGSTP
jgi:hypothetical protein